MASWTVVMSNAVQARRRWISDEQAAAIRQIDHFRSSEYQRLDIDALVDEYMQNFVHPLLALAGAPRSVADIGAGYRPVCSE